MITVSQLQITTRERLINDFSYQFAAGQIYLITAENGSGKTTLLRTMMGLQPADSGTVTFDGQPIAKARRQAFFWETSDWFSGHLSARHYLDFVRRQWRSEVAVAPVIAAWGMGDYVRVPIRKYSLGMKQRLLIALYEVSGAQFLLMDEISNGLDQDARTLLYTRLRALADAGKTILITSHYRDEVIGIADHQLMLADTALTEVAP